VTPPFGLSQATESSSLVRESEGNEACDAAVRTLASNRVCEVAVFDVADDGRR
jgi:hypothetical protein